MAKRLTISKAKQILQNNSVRSAAPTTRQKTFFGLVASGTPINKVDKVKRKRNISAITGR